MSYVKNNVTANPENRLISAVLQKGNVFVFPAGLVHFRQNIGAGGATAISGFSSQNPGVNTIGNAVFGSNPKIGRDILAKAFQVDKSVVDRIQAEFPLRVELSQIPLLLDHRTHLPRPSHPGTLGLCKLQRDQV